MDYKTEYEKSREVMVELVKRGAITKEFAKAVFPDFDESNGERIRKRIVDILGNDKKSYLEELCWLEGIGMLKWNEVDDENFKWIRECLCAGLTDTPSCAEDFNTAIDWFDRVKERLEQL